MRWGGEPGQLEDPSDVEVAASAGLFVGARVGDGVGGTAREVALWCSKASWVWIMPAWIVVCSDNAWLVAIRDWSGVGDTVEGGVQAVRTARKRQKNDNLTNKIIALMQTFFDLSQS